ncbi:MAG: DUF493 domain-containing protein [Syntrophales bacterium]|nr:DUF493 domain-containing protein [Syntrophales bacterium]
MTVEMKGKKPVLDYPCTWVYTVIGSERAMMERAIGEVFQERTCSVTPSRTSAAGTYCSLRVESVVFSDEDRRELFASLSSRIGVKIVL